MDTTTSNLGLGGAVNPFLSQNGTGVANPYLQQNIASSQADMVNAYNLAQAPGQNQAAIQSGSFGNSGLQQEADQQANILQKNLGQLANTANTNDYYQQMGEYNTQQAQQQQQSQYNSTLANQQNQFNLGFGMANQQQTYNQNMQNLQAGIGLLGTLNGYNTGAYGQASTVQNAPANYWSAFANSINGLGQGYGTSSTTQGTSSNPLLTAAGGAQLGSNIYNSAGGNYSDSSAVQSAGNANNWWSSTPANVPNSTFNPQS